MHLCKLSQQHSSLLGCLSESSLRLIRNRYVRDESTGEIGRTNLCIQLDEYHCIIGLVIFCLVFVQAAGGIIHHGQYNKLRRRTIITYAHIWLGRAIITMGMINGGLGLLLTGVSNGSYIAYGVCVGAFWLVWMGIDVWYTFKGPKQQYISEKQGPTVGESE